MELGKAFLSLPMPIGSLRLEELRWPAGVTVDGRVEESTTVCSFDSSRLPHGT